MPKKCIYARHVTQLDCIFPFHLRVTYQPTDIVQKIHEYLYAGVRYLVRLQYLYHRKLYTYSQSEL